MASLASPPRFSVAARERGRVTLTSPDGAVALISVLEDDIVRVSVLPDGTWNFRKTWAIAPGADDVATEGRDRLDLSGFTLPHFAFDDDGETLCIETRRIRLTVRRAGLFCAWEIERGGEWVRAAKDRPTQAYNFGWWDDRVHHYLVRDPSEKYFGLGERSGDMDRAGRRFRMSNLDAMGYSARTSDPLYKHIPYYLTWKPETRIAFGLFYDTLADCTFDLGCERDNYHGLYRGFTAEHGDLDYYFIAGPDIADVTRRYTWLTGKPALMPRWSLGYSGSTMSYTDAPDAQARMAEFLVQCETHDILCDSFHLSSGYTSIGARRYVFHWNREKFPDPKAFAQSYADKGVHLVPNIKPCLLRDHPLFEEARAKGLLIADDTGAPAWVQFWDEIGAYLDFTNPATLAWWKAKVTGALLDNGLDSTWNDNNEFEIVSDRALMHGFGESRPAREAKPLQALLMMRASREAQKAHAPDKRPYVVTRSGMAGMQRYAQTWSGDNSTSLGNAEIQYQDGPRPGTQRHLQFRPRHRRLRRPCARRGPVPALGAGRHLPAAVQHPLVERRRQRQRAVDASGHRAGDQRTDQAARAARALSVRPAVALSRDRRAGHAADLLRLPRRPALLRGKRRDDAGPVAAGGARRGARCHDPHALSPARCALDRLVDRGDVRGRDDRHARCTAGQAGDVCAGRESDPDEHRRTAFREAGVRACGAVVSTGGRGSRRGGGL